MARSDDNGAGILFAFLAGAAVGAAVALLFAPASGEDARQWVGERARDGRERAAEAARQGRELLNRQRETLATAVEQARQQARGGEEEPQA